MESYYNLVEDAHKGALADGCKTRPGQIRCPIEEAAAKHGLSVSPYGTASI